MTHINHGQARSSEVHARNQAKFEEKHGYPKPGNGPKSNLVVSTNSALPSSIQNTGQITDGQGLNTSDNGQPASSQVQPAVTRPSGIPSSNDTVQYLEGAIQDVVHVQDIYNKTYM